ncbi:MAG: YihY/virulence factor BrkB family protein [Methyloceanibacter sp.]
MRYEASHDLLDVSEFAVVYGFGTVFREFGVAAEDEANRSATCASPAWCDLVKNALSIIWSSGCFAMVVWLIASVAFSLYVSNFANYDRIYGSLGAVIILLFWLYISFYIVLLGAEINAELELQTGCVSATNRSG